MKIIQVKAVQGVSNIYVGESLKNVGKYLPNGKDCVIITDINVKKYYEADFPFLLTDSGLKKIPIITISTGEDNKTLKTVDIILRELIAIGADRSTFILGIGGGIVCDITGFAASIYMRGVEFGFVSTTLLSQVDASVGGKNGVNFDSYKNMVGVFCQPKFVICDTSLLKTLPTEEIANGFAEIVKHALIADAGMFDYIQSHIEQALNLDTEVITTLVEESVKLKASVVEKDEKELGERKKLNFGHTLAHAVEKLSPIGHGKAVSVGMVFASFFSKKMGFISENEYLKILQLLKSLNLPVEFKDLKCFSDKFNYSMESSNSNSLHYNGNNSLDIFVNELYDALIKDKKRDKDKISFVFLDKIGNAVVKKITFDDLRNELLLSFI